MKNEEDRVWLAGALRLATRGLGSTSPNPAVGAVLVKDGVLLGRGATEAGGRPHAEAVAIAMAGVGSAVDATLYVTLEPCAHLGRSGPCAGRIIEAGIARVVTLALDPDPRTRGRGIAWLRAAGVEVALEAQGALAEAARWQLAGHVLATVRGGRGFTQAKIAVSADGRFLAGDAGPVWVTGPEARMHGHLMRARADAIVIGAGTLRIDDPALTVRVPGLEARSPRRVVVAGRRAIDPAARLFVDGAGPVAIVRTAAAATACLPGVGLDEIVLADLTDASGAVDPGGLASALRARYGATRLLIEGGPKLVASMIERGLVDELLVYRSGSVLGERGCEPPAPLGSMLSDRSGADWYVAGRRQLGKDELTVLRSLETARVIREATVPDGFAAQ